MCIFVCVHVAEKWVSIHPTDVQCHNQYTVKAHWVPFNNTQLSTMYVYRYKQYHSSFSSTPQPLYCVYNSFSLRHLLFLKSTYIKDSVWAEEHHQCLTNECHSAGVVRRISREVQQNCLKSKNYVENNLLGLYVSRHSTFRMGSATLIERERETGKEREKLLQTRAWFMKSIPLFVRAGSLCMHNSESVRRRMSRPGGGGRGMVPLNSSGNQLVKLNIKQSDLSAISDQSHNSHTGTHKHIHG